MYADVGLTATQISVLTALGRQGRMLVGELTRREGVNKSSMTRTVAKLEAAGYITRAVDPSDRRGFLVAITAAGLSILEQADARQDAYLLRQLEALSTEDRLALEAALPVIERLLEIRA
jgi:DNA-binding MarR family transcriptional regulator